MLPPFNYNNKINKLNEEKEYILKQFNKIPELDNSIKDLQIKLADLSDTLIEITK